MPSSVRRVEWSKASENWRRWFTPGDVESFTPVLNPVLEFFGYDCDWQLDPVPVISAAESTEYVRRLLDEKYDLRLAATGR